MPHPPRVLAIAAILATAFAGAWANAQSVVVPAESYYETSSPLPTQPEPPIGTPDPTGRPGTDGYKGVDPETNPQLAHVPGGTSKDSQWLTVTWVGFKQRDLSSQVFVQTDRSGNYAVYKPDPLHIHIDVPSASILAKNNFRMLDTAAFQSRVQRVEIQKYKESEVSGVRVVITLDKPAAYSDKREGDFILVDIER
jgi:hypothetical protein